MPSCNLCIIIYAITHCVLCMHITHGLRTEVVGVKVFYFSVSNAQHSVEPQRQFLTIVSWQHANTYEVCQRQSIPAINLRNAVLNASAGLGFLPVALAFLTPLVAFWAPFLFLLGAMFTTDGVTMACTTWPPCSFVHKPTSASSKLGVGWSLAREDITWSCCMFEDKVANWACAST